MGLGDNPETLMQFKELIDRTNRERLVPKTAEECRIKFLSCITHPKPLVERALLEMQSPTYLVGGVASYGETVDKMPKSNYQILQGPRA